MMKMRMCDQINDILKLDSRFQFYMYNCVEFVYFDVLTHEHNFLFQISIYVRVVKIRVTHMYVLYSELLILAGKDVGQFLEECLSIYHILR